MIMEHLEKPYILGNGGFWLVGAKSQYLQWYLCEVDESVMWDYPNSGKDGGGWEGWMTWRDIFLL